MQSKRSIFFFMVVMHLLFGFLIADMVLNTTFEIGFPAKEDENIELVAIFCIQAILRVFTVLCFFTLLWQTFLLRIGLLSYAFQKFKLVFFVSIVSLVVLLVVRIPRLVVSIAYYVVYLRAAFRLGRPYFYKAELWTEGGP
uniref:Transmembrane protein 138 n=1 Tax=Chromera velia CCMP2878 TaxID=1169474 RepID=A0A0G4FL12_9ALVE|eukprot:Cvel_17535.t1-p1 / transcript=Cvel_17535.t1 / gene=Cvel_17535 / organism=Chromera_velia_CCMP2878 / gene_product=hypothetical protein / transcript_product=hypothetical protein / location=Cvel_scaffold1406:29453-31903(+) / protein_length=140 / sequence_SO=supercontig / SO=protein_coding / is_pseudo=false